MLNTNVIVSAALSQRSVPAAIHNAWLQGLYELVVSPALLIEYRRALMYDRVRSIHKKSDRELEALIRAFELGASIVEPSLELDVITADPDDNRVLECAVEGMATHIVSGDRHLLGVGAYQDIIILPPREFLAELHRNITEEDMT